MKAKLPVVAGVDGSEASLRAVEWAVDEAYRRTWRLHLVHVLPGGTRRELRRSPGAGMTLARESGWRLLGEAADAARHRRSLVDLTCDVLPGAVAATLTDVAARGSMLVVGARGNGGARSPHVGSTAQRVVTGARGPVVVVPEEAPPPRFGLPSVAVGIGGTEATPAAVNFALETAAVRRAELVAMHAWDTARVPARVAAGRRDDGWAEGSAGARELIDAALSCSLAPPRPVPVRSEAVPGAAWAALLRASDESDLLVLGSGPESSATPLGHVTRTVLERALCPVAVVPG